MVLITRLADVIDPADPLGPRVPFTAEAGGALLAGSELMARSWMGDRTGRLLYARWERGQREAGRLVIEAAIATAEPGEVLNAATNADIHADPAERIAVLEACGFELWQEREGFWWADRGQDLPRPERMTARCLAEVGTGRFAELIAACSAGTLDRIDADAAAAMGPADWAAALLGSAAESTWLLAEDTASGQTLGYVAIGEFDPGVGTITCIGVAPEHRGRGHVDALLKLANRTARERGFRAMLSDTDTLNVPVREALRRNGHRSEATAWHGWVHRRVV